MLDANDEKNNDAHRIKSSMMTHNSKPPTLYTYRKDHKEYTDNEKGPPVRPLCDVSDSYGHKLSHFLCTILKEVDDEQETVCDSTEDMLAAIQRANIEHIDNEEKVIGSMDVKALYPSLDISFTTEIVCEEFLKSDVKIENVDYAEMGLYLRLNRDDKYIKENKLEEICPKRKHKNGRPKITRNGVVVDKEKRWKIWEEPEREPSEEEKRMMMKESLKIALELIMNNHTYKFEDVIRRQKEGGAIGIDLTGEMARIFMCWWDRQIIEKLNKVGIKVLLYKRYVDDINMVIEFLKDNYKYEAGKLVKEERTGIEEEEKDQKMFKIIKEIGNEIHRSIQLTTDTPSENEDKKVPILDLKCWVERGRDGRVYILHEHYMKNMASRLVLHRQAAMSIQSKRTILTQQCLRIMLNCNEKLEDNIKEKHLTYFMARMQASGYDHEFRLEVLKSAMKAYSKLKERENEGGLLHRPRMFQRIERRKERLEKKKNWFGKKYETVLFVPATPDSELQKNLQRTINETNVKIKVVERSGTKLVRLLQRNDPFKEKMCPKSAKCLVCSGERPGGCRDNGVTYRIKCETDCEYEYTGQTSENGYTRGERHLQEYRNHYEKSALWKHVANVHGGDQKMFHMEIVDKVRNDPTKRQILEAVRMQRIPEEKRMNSKSEWGTTKIPRIQINTEN